MQPGPRWLCDSHQRHRQLHPAAMQPTQQDIHWFFCWLFPDRLYPGCHPVIHLLAASWQWNLWHFSHRWRPTLQVENTVLSLEGGPLWQLRTIVQLQLDPADQWKALCCVVQYEEQSDPHQNQCAYENIDPTEQPFSWRLLSECESVW